MCRVLSCMPCVYNSLRLYRHHLASIRATNLHLCWRMNSMSSSRSTIGTPSCHSVPRTRVCAPMVVVQSRNGRCKTHLHCRSLPGNKRGNSRKHGGLNLPEALSVSALSLLVFAGAASAGETIPAELSVLLDSWLVRASLGLDCTTLRSDYRSNPATYCHALVVVCQCGQRKANVRILDSMPSHWQPHAVCALRNAAQASTRKST